MVHSLRSLGSAALNWYVHFGVSLSCLVADLGQIPSLYPYFGGFPLFCTRPGPQDKLVKQTPVPAPELVSIIHVSALDQAMLTKKYAQVRIFR